MLASRNPINDLPCYFQKKAVTDGTPTPLAKVPDAYYKIVDHTDLLINSGVHASMKNLRLPSPPPPPPRTRRILECGVWGTLERAGRCMGPPRVFDAKRSKGTELGLELH